ncbi:MAG: TonB C-terminal domain-containing protein [Victivallales bacterium]|jgi:TonB family protein|nr:TonB C-terminal domain-containing protein [Victivallales bacterium]
MAGSFTVAPPLRHAEAQELISRKLRCKIGVQVVAAHCLVIFGPLGVVLFSNWRNPPENAFKVKLVGTLSTGEQVGNPTRLRPVETPKIASKPTPPPPVVTPPPPTVKPKITPKKPTPPPPVVKPKPTPKPPVVKPKPTPKAVTKKPTVPAKKPATEPKATPRKLSDAEQVAMVRQLAAQRDKVGGSNPNIAVPIGDADRAQVLGKPNYGTPGGGAKGEDERHWNRLNNYIKNRWVEPPDSLLSGVRPEVTIQLDIATDGRVTGSRIIKQSKNSAMDNSVQRMLDNLDRVPAPSNGKTTIIIILRTENQ